ncbi:hypothetical protein EV175_003083 [Coemansia sp. RSA 1933]|nr:hypothetical protein EV175_003083 [Coemansia sp. RSA 1933]
MATISPSNIHIHPEYDSTTFANNVAIVEFSFTSRGSWVNYIAVYESEWSTMYYVRLRLYDPGTQNWYTPYINGYPEVSSECQAESPLFAQNTGTMECTQVQTSNIWNNSCPMPYGSVYGVVSEGMAIGGLYSHSFMYNADFCSGSLRGLHYYVLLGNYVTWGESVIGRNINKLVNDTASYGLSAQSSSYTMTDVSNPNPQNMYTYSGNLVSPTAWNSNATGSSTSSASSSTSFTQQVTSVNTLLSSTLSEDLPKNITDQGSDSSADVDYLNPADNESLFPQPSNISYSDSTSSGAGANENSNSDTMAMHSKLSKGAKIAIAVSVTAVAVVILVVLLYKKHKGKLSLPNWFPFRRSTQPISTREELVEQIGGASETEEQLPTYDEILQTLRFSQLTTSSSNRP